MRPRGRPDRNPPPGDRHRTAVRLYRAALRWFPARVRRAHGAEMTGMFARSWAAARTEGPGATLALLARTARDLAVNGALARCDGLRRTRRRAARAHGRGGGMDAIAHDLRDAARGLRARPGLTALAVLTLAIGVGGTLAMYAIVHAAWVADLPWPAADEIVVPWNAPAPAEGGGFPYFSGPFQEALVEAGALPALAAVMPSAATVAGGERPERVDGARVSPSFFEVAGVRPTLGRVFGAEAGRPGAEATVVLAHGLWTRAFGADPGIVGRTIRVDGAPATVVGVMPPGFWLARQGVELWRPLRVDPSGWDATSAVNNNRQLVARVPAGAADDPAGLSVLEARLTAALDGVRERFPDAVRDGHAVRLVPLRDHLYGASRRTAALLMSAVVLVLLVACANLANLLLVRAEGRRVDLAVRAALGAGRRRILRVTWMESVGVAAAGTGAGLGIAAAVLGAVGPLAPPGLPVSAASISPGVLAFAAALGLATTALFGLAPAWTSGRADLRAALVDGGRGGTGTGSARFRSGVVVAEVALTALLLAASGVLAHSLLRVGRIDPGFETADRVAASLHLPRGTYPDPAALNAFYRGLSEEASGEPALAGVALAQTLPLQGGPNWGLEAQDAPGADGVTFSDYTLVTPGYFALVGMRVERGRDLEWGDAADGAPPVVVLTRSLADRLWPDGSAVGRHVNVNLDRRVWREVVGVVSDVHHGSLEAGPADVMYFPTVALPMAFPRGMELVALTRDGPAGAAALRRLVGRRDGDVALSDLRPLTRLTRDAQRRRRFVMLLLGGFGAAAVLLAAVGLYGVIAHTVALRRAEIGVRMALGAERRTIVRAVVGRSLGLAAAGALLGLLAAAGLSGVLASLLFEADPADPRVLGAVMAFLLAVAAGAAALPAWRAARVDPASTLRD